MIALLGFVLECAAVAALVGAAASALVMIAAGVLRPLLSSVRPSRRADLAFLGGVLPAIAAVAGTAAVALPSLGSALGLISDHCLEHGHHMHVCFLHGSAVRPDLAALGAAALALWTIRAGSLLGKLLQARRDAVELERLGKAVPARFPLIEVPGGSRLCHAVGSIRQRILLSASLRSQLDPVDLRCALEHEAAHLERRDPLANLLLSLADSFAVPFGPGTLARAFRNAAEQACDDAAARAVSDGALVARALVRVASLQRNAAATRPSFADFGFGEHPLETRVRRLLGATAFENGHARGLPLAGGLASAALVLAIQQATFVHHAVETVLHILF